MKKRLVLLVCGYVGMLGTQQIPLSFDMPYTISWFQKAHDVCVKAWGDLQHVQYNTLSLSDYTLIAECTLGRIVYAQWCLERMRQENTYIADEDREHFAHTCTILMGLWNQQAEFFGAEYTTCFEQMVSSCLQLLQPNNTVISSRK